MKRNIFIIGAPLYNTQTSFYSGINKDVVNFYNYFISPMGGGFYSHEIIYLENPIWADIITNIVLNPADYSIVVFSGHGYMGIPSLLTKLKINDSQNPSVLDIARLNHAPKQLFIVDACRNYILEKSDHYNFLGDAYDGLIDFSSDVDVLSARAAVEMGVNRAKAGLQIIYSCAPNETSTISNKGSFFSKSLLVSVKDWAEHPDISNVLLGVGAYKIAKNQLRVITSKQTPQIESDHGANFPFAIKRPMRRRHGFVNNSQVY